MIEQIISNLTQIIISVIDKSGYAGIFILMTAESALIPIPSEVTMTFAGYLASLGKMNFWIISFVGAFANLAGSIIAYAIGYWGEDHVVRKLIKTFGKYVLISMDEYTHAEKWFRKYGQSIVFFSRILPIIRTFISLPAGVAKMNFWRFSILTFLGSLIWSIFLTYIGFVLGKNWHSLEVYYRKFEYVIIAGGIILIGYYIWHKVKKVRK